MRIPLETTVASRLQLNNQYIRIFINNNLTANGIDRDLSLNWMNIIEVKNLVKKFGDFVAVDDISFDVKRGEIFAFLGPNGAGKSTTIKMLTTLFKSNFW